MLLIMLSFLAINTCGIAAKTNQDTIITTKIGKVQGVIEPSSIAGKMVQKFLNIPYAEPPVGKLRFSKPQPKEPWNGDDSDKSPTITEISDRRKNLGERESGTLHNSDEAIACWQLHEPGLNLTEDCLILNIWTPYPQPTNATVMVWIHGGAFAYGRSNVYLGQNFVAVGDVILVTINYRLSALGFLSTGDHRIKGNFGLFDQRLAMKWVKDNIASFGGNPQSITIFGESAGAASVSAHTLSKQSWPYFDRAILQSGTINMPSATQTKSQVKEGLRLFLSSVNCSDNENLLQCLQTNVTEKDLEKLYNSKPFILKSAWLVPDVNGDFLTDEPKNLWNNGTVKNNDVIIGITKDELFLLDGTLLQKSREVSFFTKHFETLVKNHFMNSSEAVRNQALKLYQPECLPSFIEAFKPIMAFNSDLLVNCDASSEANLRSQMLKPTNVYLYQYSYSSPIPLTYFSFYPNGVFGFAAHALDVVSTFGLPINNPNYPSEDQILSMRMILYWTNFAKNGDPNSGVTKLPVVVDKVDSLPKWPKFTNASREYLDMESLSRMIVGKRLREMHCNFLNDPEGFTAKNEKATSVPTSFAVKPIAQVALLVVVLIATVNFFKF